MTSVYLYVFILMFIIGPTYILIQLLYSDRPFIKPDCLFRRFEMINNFERFKYSKHNVLELTHLNSAYSAMLYWQPVYHNISLVCQKIQHLYILLITHINRSLEGRLADISKPVLQKKTTTFLLLVQQQKSRWSQWSLCHVSM